MLLKYDEKQKDFVIQLENINTLVWTDFEQ